MISSLRVVWMLERGFQTRIRDKRPLRAAITTPEAKMSAPILLTCGKPDLGKEPHVMLILFPYNNSFPSFSTLYSLKYVCTTICYFWCYSFCLVSFNITIAKIY